MTDIKYPKGERVFTGYYNRAGELLYIMTSKDPAREYYFLYQNVDGALKKLGKAREPPELEQKFGIMDAIRKQ